MEDTKFYRLKAIGPASALAGVDDGDVTLADGRTMAALSGQTLGTQLVLTRTLVPMVSYNNQAVMPSPNFSSVSSFGLHYIAQSDAGGDGTGIISEIADAFLVPISVDARQDGTASARMQVMFKSALTKGTTTKTLGTATDLYMLGPSTVNNVAVDNITAQNITFGLQISTNAGMSGSINATEMFIRRYQPVITITTTDVDLVADYLEGDTLSSNACVLKFARMSAPTTGYAYTVAAADIIGAINTHTMPVTGTLTITPLGNAPVSGASY